MNTKLNKVVPVLLAVVAVLAISTFQVFAHNSSENEDFSRRSSSTSTSVRVEDRVSTPSPSASGEDFSFTGTIEAISVTSYIVGGKTVVVNAGTMLDSGLVIGAVARVEVILQADGSLLAKEIETDNETEIHRSGSELGDDHGGNSGSDSSGDDNGGSGSSDDNGGTSGSGDDLGGNSGSGSSGGGDDHGGNSGKGK